MMTMLYDCVTYRNGHSGRIWSVPSAFCNDWTALKILECAKELELEKPFQIAYGFPNCEWAGGRISPLCYEGTKQIELYYRAYSNYGVRCFATFNRTNLSADQLKSAKMWQTLDVIRSYCGGVIVSDFNLAREIKDRHPSVPIVASVINPISKIEQFDTSSYIQLYNESIALFDCFVPMPEHFRNPVVREFLDEVSDRVVVLANQTCIKNCRIAMTHYAQIEKCIDNVESQPSQILRPCDMLNLSISELVDADLSFSAPAIDSMSSKGYRLFKLQGRDHSRRLFFENIANYIFEPTGIVRQIKRALFDDKSYPGIRYSIPQNRN